ncbi:TolB family protein [Alicyclobacillus macrosporangiidus]|uniref:WD40-like Beta Propeller Repeat n=1 Tax=Alicyclobacillus macrosporangiidus TaxID=392015 RepID=A0A1I7GS97_9BACL|nr:hypothetical protein [Alicyclobacillus macrosporangiidus]SFU51261.1 hypothetical protein SAMN05421543_10327 [Alicyclobacillus macrosporangiidus]
MHRNRMAPAHVTAAALVLITLGGCGVPASQRPADPAAGPAQASARTSDSGAVTGAASRGQGVPSSQPQPSLPMTFSADAWRGMGEAAILVAPASSQNAPGGWLFLLPSIPADAGANVLAGAHPVYLGDHVLTARISPDGRWVAVIRQEPSNGTADPAPACSLWLVAADGRSSQRIADGDPITGDWQPDGTFVYTDGTAAVYAVSPAGPPHQLPVSTAPGATLQQVVPNPRDGRLALLETVPDPDGQAIDRHDELLLWDPNGARTTVLQTAGKGDGFLLGPWTADGQALFYWPDPLHSASLAADGLSLHRVDTAGHDQVVTDALPGSGAIAPTAGSQAAIQTGAGRTLWNAPKQVQWWDGQRLTPVSPNPGHTQLWPTVSRDGKTVAFVEGPATAPASQNPSADGVSLAWWAKTSLVAVDLERHQRHVLVAAGGDPVQARFTPDGRVLYADRTGLAWVAPSGQAPPRRVLTVTQTGAPMPAQWGVVAPIGIADLHR